MRLFLGEGWAYTSCHREENNVKLYNDNNNERTIEISNLCNRKVGVAARVLWICRRVCAQHDIFHVVFGLWLVFDRKARLIRLIVRTKASPKLRLARPRPGFFEQRFVQDLTKFRVALGTLGDVVPPTDLGRVPVRLGQQFHDFLSPLHLDELRVEKFSHAVYPEHLVVLCLRLWGFR